ncbi:MAG: hypothetical protein COA86_03955 [Kangiella sp.]|nr:MAG: hypothetical protein COA86_04855 [Kangiella sp.]PHS19912.1 MAG: hypothetical protein COA86_03955 [Kangiella sp.]
MEIEGFTSSKKMILKLVLTSGIIVGLFFHSVIIDQISFLQLILVYSILVISMVFDYFVLSNFQKLFIKFKQELLNVNHAISKTINKSLRFALLDRFFSTFIKTLYFAFFTKFENKPKTDEKSSFSYEKSSNANDMFWVVFVFQIPTLPLIHWIIEINSEPVLAWAVTLVTIWSVIWCLAHVQACKFIPIEIDETTFKYRFGLMCKVNIPISRIKSVKELHYSEVIKSFNYFQSPLGSKKNLVIEFDKKINFSNIFLLPNYKNKAILSVDYPEKIIRQLNQVSKNID